jgi:outer membrane protein assembly factor BamB
MIGVSTTPTMSQDANNGYGPWGDSGNSGMELSPLPQGQVGTIWTVSTPEFQSTEAERGALIPVGNSGQVTLLLYVDLDTGHQIVTARDGETGAELWNNEYSSDFGRPFVAEDIVFIGSGSGMVALDIHSGNTHWEISEGTRSWTPLLVHNQTLFVDDGDSIRAVETDTGEVRWETSYSGQNVEALTVVGTTLTFVSGEIVGTELTFQGNAIHGIDMASGNEVFRIQQELNGVYRGIAKGDLLMLLSEEPLRSISAIDVSTAQALMSLNIHCSTTPYTAPPHLLMALYMSLTSPRHRSFK